MHTIRLRGPWQVEPICRFVRRTDGTCEESLNNLPSPARVTMPIDWAETCGADFLGRVRYLRTFQKPTGLDSGERVFLVVEPPRSQGRISLSRTSAVNAWAKGQFLGQVGCGDAPGRFEITDLMDEHNRLEIIVDHPALDASGRANDDGGTRLPGGLVGEVRLEIEE